SNRKRCLEDDAGEPNEHTTSKLTSNEDHLSKLPDDCIRDILERIDHADLDEAATLSRRLSDLSDSSRSKAQPAEAERLEIEQVPPGLFYLLVAYAGRKFCFDISYDGGIDPKLCRLRNLNSNTRTGNSRPTSGNANKSLTLLHRFKFRSCVFRNIIINDNMLEFIDKVISTSFVTSFAIVRGFYDVQLEQRER
ncbi:hypothetical protein PENTCL1PPCAC_23935, partial [Pristionchus entomophagus]